MSSIIGGLVFKVRYFSRFGLKRAKLLQNFGLNFEDTVDAFIFSPFSLSLCVCDFKIGVILSI